MSETSDKSAAIELGGRPLALPELAAVARGGARVRLTEAARERNLRAREQIRALIDAGAQLYGATTGVGALRDHLVPDDEREQLQWRLLRSHAVAAGPPLVVEQVRAGMLVRANQLGAGGAGVAPELLDALIDALNHGPTPVVHSLCSLGTGDLPELAEVALALLGEGRVWPIGAADAVPASPPSVRPRLGLRDALSFMSSNAFTLGRAALVCVDAVAALDRWLAVAALSFEAADADQVVFDERVSGARGSDAQARVAARMRSLLRGADRDPAAHPVHDPYCFRVLAQVDAVSLSACERLAELLERELGARAENALILDGEALPNGNFHAAELAAALDALRAAIAQSASLIAARVAALLDPRFSGLPPFLAERPGVDSGAMMLEYVAASAAAELRSLVLPMAAQTAGTSFGVESHASLATTAAARAEQALEPLELLIATELVVGVRALRMAGREARGEGTRTLWAHALQQLPAELADRPLGEDVRAAASVLRALWA
jgi:histidine ammonia-lyase